MTSNPQDPRIVRGMKTQLDRLYERLATGDKCIGWKIAYSAPAKMQQFGLRAPLTGYLTEKEVVASGTLISLADWTKAVAEPEIAVYMGDDLASGANRDTIKRAIRGIGPAIELCDSVRKSDEVEEILARNISQRGVILGPCDTTRAGCRLDGVRARIIKNGKEIANTTEPQTLPGDLLGLVGGVADRLSESGELLRAGQVIITGTIIPPLLVEAGEEIIFSLDPIGTISVSFSAKSDAYGGNNTHTI